MNKPFKHLKSQKPVAAAKPSPPKAQWSDDKTVYACNCLSTACTMVIRSLDGDTEHEAVEVACEQAIVCCTVCSSYFSYYDDSSLLARMNAAKALVECCTELITALDGAEFAGAKDLLGATQACLAQCEETIGPSEEEETVEETAVVTPAPDTATGKASPPSAAAKKNWESFASKVLDLHEKYTVKPDAKKVTARKNPGWLTVKAAVDEDEGTETYNMTIDGVIGESADDDSMVASNEFKNALAKIKPGTPINLYIKSPGGSCIDGYAIYQALRDREDDVTVHVIAALSIASIVALGGGTVRTGLASQWMIHSPLSSTYGNEEDHQDSINMLKSFGSTMADVYSAHTGMSKDDCLEMMASETWLTGKEAVEMGFADTIDEDMDEEEVSDSVSAMVAACKEATEPRYAIAAYYTPKKSISARTEAGGKTNAGHAVSTTNENKTMKVETTTPVAAATTASLEERFNQERKARISGEVTRRATGKIKNDQIDWWTNQALATTTHEAEQAVYSQLDALPTAAAPGGEALRPDVKTEGRMPIFEMPVAVGALPRANKRLDWMADARKLPSAKARVAAAKKDWTAKLNYCMELDAKENKGSLPVANNTYSATLITDFLEDQAVTILVARFAALSSFSIEFGPDRYKEYATAQTKFVTTTAATLKGTKSSPITNFEQGDGTVVPISVPMTHYAQPFNVSQEDLMSGLRVENLMQLNLLQFAKTVTLDALQPIAGAASGQQIPGPLNSSGNVVNFSAGTIHINAGTFGWNAGQTDGHDLASIWGYLKNSPEKRLVLDGNFYARLTNSPGFYQASFGDERGGEDRVKTFGWDSIEENSVWPSITDSAGNAIGGLACNRQAIIGVTGLPMTPPSIPGATLMENVVTLPGPDISISMFTWFQLAARKIWTSFELMGGFAGGDASAGAVIFNGKGSVS